MNDTRNEVEALTRSESPNKKPRMQKRLSSDSFFEMRGVGQTQHY